MSRRAYNEARTCRGARLLGHLLAIVGVCWLFGCGDSQLYGEMASQPQSDALSSPDVGGPDSGPPTPDQPQYPEPQEHEDDQTAQTLVVLSGRASIDRAFDEGALELRAAAPFETVLIHWEGAESSMEVLPWGEESWRTVELDFEQASSRRGKVELGVPYRRIKLRPSAPGQLLYVKVLAR